MRDEDILLLTFEYDRDFQNKCKNEAAITPPPPPPGFRVKQFTKVRFFSCLLYFNCFQKKGVFSKVHVLSWKNVVHGHVLFFWWKIFFSLESVKWLINLLLYCRVVKKQYFYKKGILLSAFSTSKLTFLLVCMIHIFVFLCL